MVIDVYIKNKIASVKPGACIVLDNTDYQIVLHCDSEWDAIPTKTIELVTSEGIQQNIVTNNGAGNVQKFTAGNYVLVGVKGGNLHTSTPVLIPLVESIERYAGTIAAPSQSVYDQIMALLNGFSASVSKTGNTATVSITDPQGTTTAQVSDGAAGAAGNGIQSITFARAEADGNVYTVTMTNGTTAEIKAPKGPGGGTTVEANPTLAGTEADLTGLKVGETKYKVPDGMPDASADGTIAVYKNGAWVAQTGYGFTKQSASTVTWDGSTEGKQSVTIDNVTYYKIADVPQRSTMPDTIKCTTNTESVGYGTEAGATGGAVYPVGSFVVIAATTTTIQLEGDTMTFPETGVYARKYGTTYFSSIEFPAEYQKIEPGMVPGAFRVTITLNDDESFSCDKTSGEIYKAYAEGRMIECVYDSGSGVISVLNPCAINSEACVFTLQNVANTKSLIFIYTVYDDGSVTEDSDGVDLLNAGITSLQTTNKTIVGAINELKARIDALSGT